MPVPGASQAPPAGGGDYVQRRHTYAGVTPAALAARCDRFADWRWPWRHPVRWRFLSGARHRGHRGDTEHGVVDAPARRARRNHCLSGCRSPDKLHQHADNRHRERVDGSLQLLIFGLAHISVASFIIASALGSTGLGGVQGAPLRMVILANSLPGERGTAQGLLSNFTSMGRRVGAALVGSIAASAGNGAVGYQAAFLGMTVVAGFMVALGLTLSARSAG